MARVLAPSVKAGLGVAVDQAGAPARESLALLDPVAKPVGQVLDRAGNILVAAPSDVGAYLGNPKSGFRGENLMAAAEVITRLGPAASTAVPQLIETLNDKEEAARHQAAKALEVMNKPEAKNPLRWYYLKEKIRPHLKILHITI